MKKIFLLTFLVSSIGFAQENYTIDSKYFLLGTLNDYMGRNQFSDKKEIIESFSAHEKTLVDKLATFFSKDSVIVEKIDSNNYKSVRYNLISKNLNSSINSYYDYKFSSLTYPKKDSLFRGKLKDSIFSKNSEKVSFLLGCLARYSTVLVTLNKKEFCLQFANSSSKYNMCQKIITELGFKTSKIETLPNIPRINRIYFSVDKSNYKLYKEYNLLGIELQNNLKTNFSRSKKNKK